VTAEFVSLADRLNGIRSDERRPEVSSPTEQSIPSPEIAPPAVVAPNAQDGSAAGGTSASSEVVEALREARLFRARLADAFDESAARLLRELACDVLARELRLAPCDLAALVRRVSERVPVVRVRVGAGDLGAVTGVPVVADSALCAGDAIVELAGGALDARLGVRLSAVLEAFA
jgi:flagellar biosynthesis/type III secretory pathway protein FliH